MWHFRKPSTPSRREVAAAFALNSRHGLPAKAAPLARDGGKAYLAPHGILPAMIVLLGRQGCGGEIACFTTI